MSSAFRHTASGGRHYPCISKIVAGSNNRAARGHNRSTSSRSTRGTRKARGRTSVARAVAGASA